MKKYINKIDKIIIAALAMVIGATFTMFSVQYLLLEKELFIRTSDEKLFLNAICCLVVYLFVHCISNSVTLSCIISHCVLIIFAFINYFVYQFRGNEFSFADISSASTGLSVAGKYSFKLNGRSVAVIISTIIFIIIATRIKISFKKIWQMRIIDILFIVICCIIVVLNAMNVRTETWEQKGSYQNGYILNFILEIRDSFVTSPTDYSKDKIVVLEKQYDNRKAAHSQDDVKKPTIIAIMSESYADLRVLGEVKTNIPVMPFYDSLGDNIIKGYALSSVYGAKTPNSEWEFLTGNSMAFIPDGAVVYQQYIDSQPYSLVTTLKQNDYTCVAMHPYYDTGWNRNVIYPNMGFDETYFIDDFNENKVIREYIKDEELFDKVIDRYEKKKDGDNLFIMGITMQNHGGYGQPHSNFNQKVYKIGKSYTDANQYLSLLHESDRALEKFIKYFEEEDDPVEIIFFGDHQPGLYSKFIEILNGKGVSGLTTDELEKLYTVPFFIWTNYETETRFIETTSLNYLSTLALERANIELPPYNQFLADMMEIIPAINSRGYYSKKLEKYIHLDKAYGEEAQWINNYNILEYNCMFEKERSDLFFPDYMGEKQ